MGKTIHKLIAFAICIMFVITMLNVVSAATIRWEDAYGEYYVVTNIPLNVIEEDEYVSCLQTVTHVRGTTTYHPQGGQYFTASKSATYDRPAVGNAYLIQAMERDGVKAHYTERRRVPPGTLVAASEQSGVYAIYIQFLGRAGTWRTIPGELMSPDGNDTRSISLVPQTGKIEYAPYATGSIYIDPAP